MNRIVLRTAFLASAAFAVVLVAGSSMVSFAQQPANAQAAAPVAAQPIVPDYNPKVDWPWLGRYKAENAQLSAPKAGENRVVFMGDSITEAWGDLDESFPQKPYVNRGISGQTTPQMLLRFRQDVIDLNPKAVVILAGINDIAGNSGPETLEQIEGNLASMAELATAHHLRVVLCSILPAAAIPWRPTPDTAQKVITVNAWLRSFAADHGYVYVDYHTAMKDAHDGLPATLSKDGIHPLPAGYAVMAPLVEAGIEKALK